MAKSRDLIRQAIFSEEKRKAKSIVVVFFGEEIELRQPDLTTILSWNNDAPSRADAMLNMLLAYAYVPGTDEHVFEEDDREIILTLPFGSDFTRLQEAIAKLTDLEMKAKSAEKNSDATANASNS